MDLPAGTLVHLKTSAKRHFGGPAIIVRREGRRYVVRRCEGAQGQGKGEFRVHPGEFVLSGPAPDLDARYCPACGADWQGEPIPEHSRHHYGGRTHFRRAIFINHPSEGGRRGGNTIKCPDCGAEWAT